MPRDPVYGPRTHLVLEDGSHPCAAEKRNPGLLPLETTDLTKVDCFNCTQSSQFRYALAERIHANHSPS